MLLLLLLLFFKHVRAAVSFFKVFRNIFKHCILR